MIGIIVTGHGNFASGLTSSVELVIGAQEHYFALDFDGVISLDELSTNIETAIKQLSDCEQIFIFTDLLGGSPFRQSALATLNHQNISVFAGTNLPMLVECLMSRNYVDDIEQYANNLVELAKNQIIKYETIKTEAKTNEVEEGI